MLVYLYTFIATVYLYTCIPVYLYTSAPVYLYACITVYLNTRKPVYLYTRLHVDLYMPVAAAWHTCVPACRIAYIPIYI